MIFDGLVKVFNDVPVFPVQIIRLLGKERPGAGHVIIDPLEGMPGMVQRIPYIHSAVHGTNTGTNPGGHSLRLSSDSFIGLFNSRGQLISVLNARDQNKMIVCAPNQQVPRELFFQRIRHQTKQNIACFHPIPVVI